MFTLRTKHKIFIARLAYYFVRLVRSAMGKSSRLVIERSGLMWALDLTEGIDFTIYLLGAFEPRTVRLYKTIIKSGDIVADIGANIGAHTLPLANLVGKTGKVIGFEPTSYAFGKLKSNIALNPGLADRIDVRQAMLVAADGDSVEPEIYSSWPLGSGEAVHEMHRGKLMNTSGAIALTFDAAIASYNLHKLDFIKLDVDGHEFEVLSGAAKTLERFRPTILMELEPCLYSSKMHEFEGIIAILRKLNGKITDVNTGVDLVLDAQALHRMIPEGASRNVLVRFDSP